ncbi:putative ribonuclease H-like domain-containing protein [Tanacetum coccineum]
MEFESAQSNTTAKLPILKLGEYEMWVIRIKQYFQVQDYALWEVIENGNSWVSVPQTAQENGTSVTKMSVPVTAKEKTNKKNDVKARSLRLMDLPNEHQLTFSQYTNAKTIFAAIKTRFGGNEATKKTHKTLLKQQYENFSASSLESLDSIFNTLQKIVSRLAILVWMNKAEIKIMSIDDFYNNFKIVKQSVKKSVGVSSGAQNLAFMTAPSTSSTDDFNTAIHAYEVSTASSNVNTASPQVSTASFSDNVVYAFMIKNPNGSNLLHQDLEQIHKDDLELMDLKWQLSLLRMRAKRYYYRTGKKFFINANDTAEYDKSKVECFNCHKMGHFARECRAPRNKEGFDWSDMAEEQVQTNMALMAFSDSEAHCKYHQRERMVYGNNYNMVNYNYTTNGTHPNAQRNMVPRAVLMKTGLKPFNTARALPDENQILLKISRKENMYSLDMKNIIPKESFTCLVAKATLDESMLWHRRLGHINFKNINKLVKDNLVRGLRTKRFENNQTRVACLKGKQYRASCKSKVLIPITKPLFMLHIDLFGPTFASSLMHKKYCLVVTDDYNRFTWVFFLTTKDETNEILKNFIIEIENLVDKKVNENRDGIGRVHEARLL